MHPAVSYQGQVPVALPVYRDVAPWILPGRPIRLRRQRYALPTFVNSTTAASAGTSITINVPTGTANGDLLIVYICCNTNPVTAHASWEFVEQYNTSSNNGAFTHIRIASSEPASYTFTIPAAAAKAVMHAWRGVDQSNPIMAASGHPNSPADAKPDTLFFRRCDFMAVAFAGEHANLAVNAPSGWTTAGQLTASPVSVCGAYKSFTATEGLDGPSQNSWARSAISTATFALRAAGQDTLSLKHHRGWQAAGAGTTISPSVPTLRRSGDLLVVIGHYFTNNDASTRTFSASAGWTQHATTQQYVISAVPTFNVIGACVFQRVSTGGESTVTLTTSAAIDNLFACTLVFSTGSSGAFTAQIVGTMGQANDTSADANMVIPAATVPAYALPSILVGVVIGNRGDLTITAPAGWEWGRWALPNAMVKTDGWASKLPLHTTANPPSVNATQSPATQVSMGLQFAVGTNGDGLLGAGFPEVRTMMIGS